MRFDSWRRVGSAMQAVKVYNLREVDELVFLDITRHARGSRPRLRLVDELADECFMPLTVGGGVRTIDDVRGLLMVGADKVVDQHGRDRGPGPDPRSRATASARSASSCRSTPRRNADGTYEVYTHAGHAAPTGLDPVDRGAAKPKRWAQARSC